jgi:hypothetical protein
MEDIHLQRIHMKWVLATIPGREYGCVRIEHMRRTPYTDLDAVIDVARRLAIAKRSSTTSLLGAASAMHSWVAGRI